MHSNRRILCRTIVSQSRDRLDLSQQGMRASQLGLDVGPEEKQEMSEPWQSGPLYSLQEFDLTLSVVLHVEHQVAIAELSIGKWWVYPTPT